MTREAMRLALEALEDVPYMSNKDDYSRLNDVIAALRAALDESERDWSALEACQEYLREQSMREQIAMIQEPQETKWVGLTDEEMDMLVARFARHELARAIEAKLKEKNHVG